MEFTDICSLEDHNLNHQEPQQCGSWRFPGIPESVLLDFFDAEPLHVRLTQAEDEAGLAKFEVDLNEGRLDQVGDVLQMNGGGLLLFVVLFYAGALRELSHLLR